MGLCGILSQGRYELLRIRLRTGDMSTIMRDMIVDFHTHVVPPKIKQRRAEYARRDPCFSLLYSEPKAKLASAEELIEAMDECGVDRAVVLNLGWASHELCVETNDYILEAVARYPERLVGFCAIQPAAGGKAVKELERCAENGARGLGELRPDVQGFDLRDEPVMKPVIETVMEHSLVFLIHASEPVGHQYAGKGGVTPEMIYPFILSFPGLKLVCAHWGGGLPFYGLIRLSRWIWLERLFNFRQRTASVR